MRAQCHSHRKSATRPSTSPVRSSFGNNGIPGSTCQRAGKDRGGVCSRLSLRTAHRTEGQGRGSVPGTPDVLWGDEILK